MKFVKALRSRVPTERQTPDPWLLSRTPFPDGTNRVAFFKRLYTGLDPQSGSPLFYDDDDSAGIVGPPRAGKTSGLLVPQILMWSGALVATSTKAEILTLTGNRRKLYGGAVSVYAPTATGQVEGLTPIRWSPLERCDDPTICSMRVNTMLAAAAHGIEDSDFWRAQAAAVLTAYFHAAAISPACDMRQIMGWLATGELLRPVELLLDHGRADAARWARGLEAFSAVSDKERGAVWAVAKAAMRVFDSEVVLRNVTPDKNAFDTRRFVTTGSTLYVVAPAEHQAATAPLISGLIEAIVSATIDTDREAQSERREGYEARRPRLLLALDEVANIAPLPSLPTILSQGSSQGVLVSWAAQSLSQLRARWGADTADTIWTSSRIKLIFGGLADHRDLEAMSRLAGEIEVQDPHGFARREPRLPVDVIAQLPAGRALVSYPGFAPGVRLVPPYSAVPSLAAEIGWEPPPRTSRPILQRGLASVAELVDAGFIGDTIEKRHHANARLPQRDSGTRLVLGTVSDTATGESGHVAVSAGETVLLVGESARWSAVRVALSAVKRWRAGPVVVVTSRADMIERLREECEDREMSVYDLAASYDGAVARVGWTPITPEVMTLIHYSHANALLGVSLWVAAVAGKSIRDVRSWFESDHFAPALAIVDDSAPDGIPFFNGFRYQAAKPRDERSELTEAALAQLGWIEAQLEREQELGIPVLKPASWAEEESVIGVVIPDRLKAEARHCARMAALNCLEAAQMQSRPGLVVLDELGVDLDFMQLVRGTSRWVITTESTLGQDESVLPKFAHSVAEVPMEDQRVRVAFEGEMAEFIPDAIPGEAPTLLLISRDLRRPCLIRTHVASPPE